MFSRHDPLVLVTALLSVAAVGFAVAMAVDPRLIDGAPAWLKPLKFAVSTTIYSGTLAWMFRHLPGSLRLTRRVGLITAAAFVLEVVIIAVQAARGVTSHFNTSTPVDGVLYSIMGIAILAQTVAALAATIAFWRHPIDDRATGWALRTGLALAVAGAAVGGVMTQPTSGQLAAARETGALPRAGAHTVGAPDGGPGLPGTGWSRAHGDLRVPHFVGLHAMQVLPLVAMAVAGWRRERARVRLVATAGVSYAAFFAILLAQALLGQPALAPRGAVAGALAVWAAASAAAVFAVWRGGRTAALRRPGTATA